MAEARPAPIDEIALFVPAMELQAEDLNRSNSSETMRMFFTALLESATITIWTLFSAIVGSFLQAGLRPRPASQMTRSKPPVFVASLRRCVSKGKKNQGSLTQRRYGATFRSVA